jgi:hypothetical protein
MSQKQRTRRSKYRTGGNGRKNVTLVNSTARDVLSPQQLEALRHDCGRAGRITDPLEAELWASAALGRMWQFSEVATAAGQPDWQLGLGAPVARAMARIGGTGARGLLLAWAALAEGRFRRLCRELASGVADPAPAWTDRLGAVRVSDALSDLRPGDGEVICLQLERLAGPLAGPASPPCERFSLAAFIDDRHGAIAERLHLLGSLDAAGKADSPRALDDEGGDEDQVMRFEPIEVGEACRRLRGAIARSDRVAARAARETGPSEPPLADGYVELRALALAWTAPYARLQPAEAA